MCSDVAAQDNNVAAGIKKLFNVRTKTVPFGPESADYLIKHLVYTASFISSWKTLTLDPFHLGVEEPAKQTGILVSKSFIEFLHNLNISFHLPQVSLFRVS